MAEKGVKNEEGGLGESEERRERREEKKGE